MFVNLLLGLLLSVSVVLQHKHLSSAGAVLYFK
jgi:hypothetical protein